MKWLFALFLLLSCGASAATGFKLGADTTKWLTWYGGTAVYQQDQEYTTCTFDKVVNSVDQWGDAYRTTSFNCKKDLFIVVKEYIDIDQVLLILIDPAHFDDRKVYKAELFLTYEDKKEK